MADERTWISNLPDPNPLDGTEELPMDQNGTTRKITSQEIANLSPGGPGFWNSTGSGGNIRSNNTGNIGIGTEPDTILEAKVHLGSNVDAGENPDTLLGMLFENFFQATVGGAQASIPATFKGTQYDVLNDLVLSTQFKIFAIAENFSNGVRKPTALICQSSDSGVVKNVLLIFSDGNVSFGNGITINGFTKLIDGVLPGVMEIRSNPGASHGILFSEGTGYLAPDKSLVKIQPRPGTYGPTTGALDVGGDAGNDVLKAYNSGTTRFGSGTPDPLALIDMKSTGKLFLPSRFTTAQRDSIQWGFLSVAMTAGGAGYVIPPTVNVTGLTLGGLPPRLKAVIAAGSVTGILVEFRGTSIPSTTGLAIVFNNTGTGGTGNPDGSGAVAGAITLNEITIPEGLEGYNLTIHKKQFYNGSAWETVTSS